MSTAQKKKPNQKNASSIQEQASELVCDYPISSSLVVFGIGLWAGVALGGLLNGASAKPTLGRRTELAAEQLGRQMLGAIAGVLPPSLAKHIEV